MFPLRFLLSYFVVDGDLTVIDHKGCAHRYGVRGSEPKVAIRLHDPGLYLPLAVYPSLHIGRAYVQGSLTIEEGKLLDFINLLLINQARLDQSALGSLRRWREEVLRWPAVVNLRSRARRNIHHHYDYETDFYRLFLDNDLQYSCAYFSDSVNSLEEAQEAKKRHIASKLALRRGMRVLDVGCGFGGLALYLARNYGVHVTGITLSTEQLRTARDRAAKQGLAHLVDFRAEDYRTTIGRFDRIVSVGMFEHVGRPHYGQFFKHVQRLLADNGVAVLHTIGRHTLPSPINVWIRKNIFPGAYVPTMSQLSPILEARSLWLTDFENLRLHYAMTLADWHRRFQANRQRVRMLDPKRFDDRFCRMWEYYLQSCEASFRCGGLTVFQLQFTKRIDALPITRDHIFAEEQRLLEQEAHESRPRMAGE
jgi:cyclopropane-fatty-acyl-phospholipid synthase